MIKKYGIFGFSALALLAIGCGDSSTGSGTTLQTYPSEINEEAKTISITLPTCEQISETEVHFDPEGEKNTFEYELSGTSLFLDDGFDITEFTGNNSSLYGTWTIADLQCIMEGFCEILDITPTSVTRTIDVSDVCAFDYMVANMFSEESDDGKEVIPDFTKSSCTSGLIYLNGKAVNITITEFDESTVDMTLIADGTKCRFYMDAIPLTASTGTIENIDYIADDVVMKTNMEEFFECYLPLTMDDYNYYQGYALEKAKKLKSMSKLFSEK